MRNARIVSCIISWSILVLCPFAVCGTTFTLSDSALMSLDYDYPYYSNQSATITNITDVEGPGVRFDIMYPDPHYIRDQMPDLFWTSCIYGGNGTLTGIDISSFDAFALKFTLLSANGVSVPAATGPVIVGALINLSDATYAYRPEVIAFNDPYEPASATSVTTLDVTQIEFIGFTCHPPYWWYDETLPNPWDPDGAIISLLVEQANDAVVITPEPATLLLLGAGIAFLRRK